MARLPKCHECHADAKAAQWARSCDLIWMAKPVEVRCEWCRYCDRLRPWWWFSYIPTQEV